MKEAMYQIWKDGKYTGRDVGILYMTESGFKAKERRLFQDYPVEEGYELKAKYKKITESTEDILNRIRTELAR